VRFGAIAPFAIHGRGSPQDAHLAVDYSAEFGGGWPTQRPTWSTAVELRGAARAEGSNLPDHLTHLGHRCDRHLTPSPARGTLPARAADPSVRFVARIRWSSCPRTVLMALRDPMGGRPLALGKANESVSLPPRPARSS